MSKTVLSFREAQFFCFQARAMRAHAEIVSGAYKLRDVADLNGVQKSDEWKLKDKIDEMNRHINFMQESAEGFEVK